MEKAQKERRRGDRDENSLDLPKNIQVYCFVDQMAVLRGQEFG